MAAYGRPQRAEGPATIMAIGTATPTNCVDQTTYPDYYFRVTKSEHMKELKDKFKRICERTTIKKRYIHLTEEIMQEYPTLCEHMAPSLDARLEIAVEEIPKLGKSAAEAAIKEWGRPRSSITHLIFCTSGCIDLPGADYKITKLLGLNLSVNRFMIYNQACFAGGTALRLAKDLAENNAGARILIVCSEMTVLAFRGPSEDHVDRLVGEALFGDGAAAVIIGSDPVIGVERPLFEVYSAAQTLVPGSDGAVEGHLRESGLSFHLGKEVPNLISKNIGKCLENAFAPLGITDWNSIFWIPHPGGPAILDKVEAALSLKPEKFGPTRRVLRDYGNIWSASVLFIMDEMRKVSAAEGRSTTGEGHEWGVLFGFGPGFTVETVVLRSLPTNL